MLLVLVNPNHALRSIQIPPIGLGYLATAVRKHTDWDVHILDAFKDDLSHRSTVRTILDLDPTAVGFVMLSRDHENVAALANSLEEARPQVVTIAGGPHASAIPEPLMQRASSLDFVILGEGENPLVELLQQLDGDRGSLESIAGLARRVNGEILTTPISVQEDIDEYDIPSWDLMDPRRYPPRPQGAFTRRLPVAPIVATRGCPYSCTYCAAHVVSGKKIRWRSIDLVLKEIDLLVHTYGIKELHFSDDNFTFDKSYVMELCGALRRRGYDLSLACPNGVRLDALDEELIRTMEAAGFYSFSVGVETVSPRLLKKLRRGVSVETMTEKVNMIARVSKIRMTAFLMYGLPTQTREEIAETIEYALRMPFHRAQFVPLVPLPGTAVYDELVAQHALDPRAAEFERLTAHESPFAFGEVPRDELPRLAATFYRRFYLRPAILCGLLGEIRSIRQAWGVVVRLTELVETLRTGER